MSLYTIQKLSKDIKNTKKGSSCKIPCDDNSKSDCGSNSSNCSVSSSESSCCIPNTTYSPIHLQKPKSEDVEIKEPLEPEFTKCEHKCVPKCEHKHKSCKPCESDSESDCESTIPSCPNVPEIKLPKIPCKPECPEKPECDFSPIRIKMKKICCKRKKCKKICYDDSIPCIKVRKPEELKPLPEQKICFPSLPECGFSQSEEFEKPRMPHKAKVCTSGCGKKSSNEVHQIEHMQFPKIRDVKF